MRSCLEYKMTLNFIPNFPIQVPNTLACSQHVSRSRHWCTGWPHRRCRCPNRLEINDFVHPDNIEQFSLFVQALSKPSFVLYLSPGLSIDCRILAALQNKPQTEPLSYFGISGIHGLPYVQWEGAGGSEKVEG